MIKVSDALDQILKTNDSLLMALSNDLLNLTQLANFLKPLVEARTQKKVQVSTLVMALSRYKNRLQTTESQKPHFVIQNLQVISNLMVLTFEKTDRLHQEINQLYKLVQKEEGFITITEGQTEITTILEDRFNSKILNTLSSPSKAKTMEVSGLSVKFDPLYAEIPGFMAMVMQKLSLQHVNIVEVSSTHTELILYLKNKDVRLAFDTLFQCFRVQQKSIW